MERHGVAAALGEPGIFERLHEAIAATGEGGKESQGAN